MEAKTTELEQFLNECKRLSNGDATFADFTKVCVWSISLVEGSGLDSSDISEICIWIAEVWFRTPSIQSNNLLDEIGGTFADNEPVGSINLLDPQDMQRWLKLKSWISQAQKLYGTKNA